MLGRHGNGLGAAIDQSDAGDQPEIPIRQEMDQAAAPMQHDYCKSKSVEADQKNLGS